MRLAPQVQEFLNAPGESLDHLTVSEQRQRIRELSDINYHRYGRSPEPACISADHRVPVGDGAQITVRAYRPCADAPATGAPLPAHVELHGGGWWLGSIDEHVNEAICRYRCVHAHCVVFAVEYRLAPEHPFPAAVNDVYATLTWITGHATELGIDPGRLSVGGTSAGANLAAAATILARDRAGPQLPFQLLEVPALDLTGKTMRAALATEELAPLARHIGEFETPKGERYAERLAQAGVPVTVTRCAGAVHGTSFLTRVWPPAQDWQRDAAAAIRRSHERDSGVGRLSW